MAQLTVIPIIIGHTELPRATGSVTLVTDVSKTFVLLVDCGDPWNGKELKERLREAGVDCEEVTHVVITHGHIDHCGNINQFPQAQFYMARDIAGNSEYSELTEDSRKLFTNVELFVLDGHTDCDLVVVVHQTELGTIVIAGDLFESEHDEEEFVKYSKYPDRQRSSRNSLKGLADYIVPGHGEMFAVPKQHS